jgi:hypothetical protein
MSSGIILPEGDDSLVAIRPREARCACLVPPCTGKVRGGRSGYNVPIRPGWSQTDCQNECCQSVPHASTPCLGLGFSWVTHMEHGCLCVCQQMTKIRSRGTLDRRRTWQRVDLVCFRHWLIRLCTPGSPRTECVARGRPHFLPVAGQNCGRKGLRFFCSWPPKRGQIYRILFLPFFIHVHVDLLPRQRHLGDSAR